PRPGGEDRPGAAPEREIAIAATSAGCRPAALLRGKVFPARRPTGRERRPGPATGPPRAGEGRELASAPGRRLPARRETGRCRHLVVARPLQVVPGGRPQFSASVVDARRATNA